MKLRKEDIQKIVLGGLMGLGVIYGYFDILLNPLKKRQLNTANSIVSLDPEIEKSRNDLKKSQGMEADEPKFTALVAQVNAMIPEGAPVAWFPTLLTDFFKKQGVDKVATRLNNEVVDPKLVGYKRFNWGIDVPKADCLSFATALAELENAEPLLEIQTLTIESLRDEPEVQRVLLTVNNIVKQ
jgi:hypothetical protein